MQSFGLWYKQRNNDSGNPEISLHVNLWCLEEIETTESINAPFLDIGIKVQNYTALDTLTFHCPFILEKNNIDDLSCKLEKKENATIIFNKDCEINTKGNYTVVQIQENGKVEEKLLIFPLKLAFSNLYSIEKLGDIEKTNIVFDFKDFITYVENTDCLQDIQNIYLRFRIKSLDLKNKLYFDTEPLNKSFDSAFSGTRIIDFKVNEKRNIDNRIKAESSIQEQKWPVIKRIHFLVMEPAAYNLTSFFEEDAICRELENDIWNDYLGTNVDFHKGRVLVYHWKGAGESFSCLVKVNYSRTRKFIIFSYSTIVVVLGMLGSTLASFLFELFKPDPLSITQLVKPFLIVVLLSILVIGGIVYKNSLKMKSKP